MLERDVLVPCETVRRWCARFGQVHAGALCRRRPRPGNARHLDEGLIKINGERKCPWRAADAEAPFWTSSYSPAGPRTDLTTPGTPPGTHTLHNVTAPAAALGSTPGGGGPHTSQAFRPGAGRHRHRADWSPMTGGNGAEQKTVPSAVSRQPPPPARTSASTPSDARPMPAATAWAPICTTTAAAGMPPVMQVRKVLRRCGAAARCAGRRRRARRGRRPRRSVPAGRAGRSPWGGRGRR